MTNLAELGLAPIFLPTGQEIWIRKASFAAQATGVRDLSPLARELGGGNLTNATLGPGVPMAPAHPEEAEPRRWAYQPGLNIRTQPRGTEAISFATLRAIADNYDVARLCIEKRKDEMRDLRLVWRPTPVEGEKREEAKARRATLEPAIREATERFTKPNLEDFWAIWLSQWLEDLFRYDAATLFLRPARDGSLFSIEIIDGSTIRPIIDLWGRVPQPPEPAYGQVLFGVTWGAYTTDELLYTPYWQRSDSPYGHPPAEWILIAINRALRRQSIDLSNYTEGTLPVGFYKVPETWSGGQIGELQEIFDAILGGNDLERSRVRFVPGGPGTGLDAMVPEPKTEVEEWLLYVTCAAYGVSPIEFGFQPRGSGLGGKGFHESQQDVTRQRSLKPLANHIAGVLTWIANSRMGLEGIEAAYPELEDPGDILKIAQTDQIYLQQGKVSVDELRERDDQDPIGLGPYVIGTPTLVDDLLNPPEPPPALLPPGTPADPAASAAPGVAAQGARAQQPDSGGEKPLAKAAADDLERWQRKALKAVRAGRRADVTFTSAAIDQGTSTFLAETLAKAAGADDVRAAFTLAKAGASAGPFVPEPRVAPRSGAASPGTSPSWATISSLVSGYRRWPSAPTSSMPTAGSSIS